MSSPGAALVFSPHQALDLANSDLAVLVCHCEACLYSADEETDSQSISEHFGNSRSSSVSLPGATFTNGTSLQDVADRRSRPGSIRVMSIPLHSTSFRCFRCSSSFIFLLKEPWSVGIRCLAISADGKPKLAVGSALHPWSLRVSSKVKIHQISSSGLYSQRLKSKIEPRLKMSASKL